jgi:hypothetical protein
MIELSWLLPWRVNNVIIVSFNISAKYVHCQCKEMAALQRVLNFVILVSHVHCQPLKYAAL